MDRNKAIFFTGLFLAICSFLTSYWALNHESVTSIILVWFICPLAGIFQVLKFTQNKPMSIGLINAAATEHDKRRFILVVSFMLIALPLLSSVQYV